MKPRLRWNLGLLVALLAVLTACSGPAAPIGSPSPSSPTPSAATTALTITYDSGTGENSTWQLTCDPAGGNHPDPKTACLVLDKSGSTALPAVPTGKLCSQVYGGPQTAVITGTWRGEIVNSRLNRRNGCQIARWTALVGLLPRAGA